MMFSYVRIRDNYHSLKAPSCDRDKPNIMMYL